MNTVIETILTRRSTRAFQNKPISDEDLNLILQAAIYAPTGMNKQTWKFTAVVNRDLIQKLAKAIGEELGRENYDMYSPEVLIIPSNTRDSHWGKEDNACALENIFLAAHSLGIGSVWINQLQGICDAPAIRSILDELQIPADHIVYGLAAIGYAADMSKKDVKKTGEITIIR